MLSVRENYLRAFPKRKDFIEYMSQWVIEPNAETSIMLDAIKKYKLMPLLGYEVTTIEDIAAYIYDTDFLQIHEGHKDKK
ncbi:MAG: cytochrome C [Sulfurimonas sp.]|nr:cytochrome C [Sulfurimonas sp.]